MSRRTPLTLALAVAALAAGCSREDVRYPAGWPPLAVAGHDCPALRGDFRLDPSSAVLDAQPESLAAPAVTPPGSAPVAPGLVSITANANGSRIDVRTASTPRPGADPAWTHRLVDVGAARCDGGLLTIERHDTRDGWTALNLGRDIDGRLVAQRLTSRARPLFRWGDTPVLSVGHVTRASWGRWKLQPPAAPSTPPAAVAAAPANGPDPATPPSRPGALPLVEAQAIVLAALPDSALFQGMTPTPTGYRLHLVTQDAHAVDQFARRLATDGHFAVHADAPAAAASGASAPASAGTDAHDANDVMLDLVERIVH